jgi:predicted P-loop ATPase
MECDMENNTNPLFELQSFSNDEVKRIANNARFSYFEGGITNIKPIKAITFSEFVNMHQKGTSLQERIKELREAEYHSERYRKIKEELPYITPSGIFSERKNDAIASYSGIICFDVDCKENPNVDICQLKGDLQKDVFVLMVYISPGGKGLKFMVPIQAIIKTHKAGYKCAMRYFETKYSIKLDSSQGNLSQACFFSYDEDININFTCEPFFPVEDLIPASSKQQTAIIRGNNLKDAIEFAKHIVEKKHNLEFVKGSRNKYVFHFACISNRLGLAKENLLEFLTGFDDTFFEEASKIIQDVYTRYVNEHGSKVFSPFNKQLKEERFEVNQEVRRLKKMGLQNSEILSELKKKGYEHSKQLLRLIEKSVPEKLDFVKKHLEDYHTVVRNKFTGFPEIGGKLISDESTNDVFISIAGEAEKVDLKGVTKDDVLTIINSNHVRVYNPIEEFVTKNKDVDFKGSLDALISVVETNTPYFSSFFKKWIVNMIAMLFELVDNPLLILFVGKKNTGKTTFFRELLPEELRRFIVEMPVDNNYEFSTAMAQNILIIDDEFESKRKSTREAIKAMLTRKEVDVRIKYGKFNTKYKRNASIVATSNDLDVFEKFDDNRRIIPVEVISVNQVLFNSISKVKVFMDAYNLYKSGFNYRLTSEDIQILDNHSDKFRTSTLEKELFLQYLIIDYKKIVMPMKKSEIQQYLEEKSGQRVNWSKLSEILRELDVPHSIKAFPSINGKVSKLDAYYVAKSSGYDTGYVLSDELEREQRIIEHFFSITDEMLDELRSKNDEKIVSDSDSTNDNTEIDNDDKKNRKTGDDNFLDDAFAIG